MTCKCEKVLEAFGQPACVSLFGATKGILVAKDTFYYPADIEALASGPHFLKVLRNVSVEATDPQFQEFEDGYKVFIRDGQINFTALVPQSTFERVCRVKALQCFTEVYAFLVDKTGKILTGRAVLDSTGSLSFYPLKLSAFIARPIFASDTAVQSLEVRFTLETEVCDLNLVTLQSNILDVDPLMPLRVWERQGVSPGELYLQIGFSDFTGDPLPTISPTTDIVAAPTNYFSIKVNGTALTSGVTLAAVVNFGRRFVFSPALLAGDVVEIESLSLLHNLGYHLAKTKITI